MKEREREFNTFEDKQPNRVDQILKSNFLNRF